MARHHCGTCRHGVACRHCEEERRSNPCAFGDCFAVFGDCFGLCPRNDAGCDGMRRNDETKNLPAKGQNERRGGKGAKRCPAYFATTIFPLSICRPLAVTL
ncbi:MAG: hypothetical protein LBL18_00085 [Bacteroidales bacterium]|nr:hypothetical protein [Bacteroidales bacterium]